MRPGRTQGATIAAHGMRAGTSAITIVASAAAALVLFATASPGHGASGRTMSTLKLQAELQLTSRLAECPAGVTASACAARTGKGLAPGLGRVTYAYSWRTNLEGPSCGPEEGKTQAYGVRLTVAGKGDLELALAEGARCVSIEDVRTQTQAFTITGGTGMYQGASGSGVVDRTLGTPISSGDRQGRETWTGTLDVPALEFNLTPPTFSGVAGKLVRVSRTTKRARVTYAVTARDDLDGDVAVSCSPRSGTRFPIGRTVISCSAADTSGNVKTAKFSVTVKRR